MISRTVLDKGLDSGTAFRILSIDIADVDVGQNIGAKLQTEQAEADKQIAQARAEGRRAMAVASGIRAANSASLSMTRSASRRSSAANFRHCRAPMLHRRYSPPTFMASRKRRGSKS